MAKSVAIEPRLLNRIEAARYCGISVNHFLTHVPVAPRSIGAKKLWDRKAIDRWLDDGPDGGDGGLSAEEWLERA